MQVDVRVIATTNRDLTQSVADGTFRQDLYYRLNVLPVALPPLRERGRDVALLADHFLRQVAEREGSTAKQFDGESVELLCRYPWPGNVRELQNICERASVLSAADTITAATIRPWLVTSPPACVVAPSTPQPAAPPALGSPALQVAGHVAPPAVATVQHAAPRQLFAPTAPPPVVDPPAIRPLDEVERDQIIQTLGQFDGNRTRTAQALGIGVRTLGLKLKKWKEQNLVAQTV